MKRATLFTALLLLAASTKAEWVVISKSAEDGITLSIDPTSITSEGQFARIWELWEFEIPLALRGHVENDLYPNSLLALSEFDCHQRRRRYLQKTTYSKPHASGEVRLTSGEESWIFVPPGTSLADEMSRVCRGK